MGLFQISKIMHSARRVLFSSLVFGIFAAAILFGQTARATEFPVNTTLAGSQTDSAIATLSNGDFVVVWADNSQTGGDSSFSAIRAQRFDTNGVAQGAEFLVNTTTFSDQSSPDIAALEQAGFVIVWADGSRSDPDSKSSVIRAQIYDVAGVAQGAERLVHTPQFSTQAKPAVAGLIGGKFVIAWEDTSQTGGDTDSTAIQARVYNNIGLVVGNEFLVNTTTAGMQTLPAVSGLQNGAFVIVWEDYSNTGADSSSINIGAIRAREYDTAGVALGPDFLVNTTTADQQRNPDVAGFLNGGYVVVWGDRSQFAASGEAIRGQLYDDNGAAFLSEFLVNTTSFFSDRQRPSVAMLSTGGFVVAFTNTFGGGDSDSSVRAQRFNNFKEKAGGEFLVNTITAGPQRYSSIEEIDGIDRFVIAWDSGLLGSAKEDIRADIINSFPKITVTGMGVSIANGDTTPSLADDTSFNNVAFPGGSVSHTFTIINAGTANLDLNLPVAISGPDAADFTITTQPSTPIPPSAAPPDDILFTEMVVKFSPSAQGARHATISINSNDANATPFTFDIQGNGPEIGISGNGISIADGSTVANAGDGTFFGSVAVSGGLATHTFVISNTGNATLNLNNPPGSIITGLDAGDFLVTTPPSASIAPGSSTNMVVQYSPLALGVSSDAAISINNDDPDENPFDFAISGVGVNSPPTGQVIITGPLAQGQTLVADTSSVADADGLGPFSYQWRRSSAPIAGANASSYVLTASDVGFPIDVIVSYIDGLGTAENITSDPTPPVLAFLTLTVTRSGLGTGTVTSAPAGIDCGATCVSGFAAGINVTLTQNSPDIFTGWSGACSGTGACVVTIDKNGLAVDAHFILSNPPATTLFSSELPTARSGFVGGDPVTVFATVINAGSHPAQNCLISVPAGSPVALSYQETDAANVPTGTPDMPFDLTTGQKRSFVLAFTPTAVNTGIDLFPGFDCDNANVSAIPGVNTVFLSIDDHAVPDILSIGVTPSGDGIITVPSGSISFMSAAATNIGVGDAAGSADAAVTVFADTGAASLPLLLQLCETDAASTCISPLGTAPVSTVIGAGPSFFAVFVSDQASGGVALDAANARVFLRFKDAAGIVRSVTSAAVTVTAPADKPVHSPATP